MTNISAVVQSIRNIMRNDDKGISGDAQRLEQLGWMLFLKILDAKEQEFEVTKENYTSLIPTKFQWRNWAEDSEGITGDDLLAFIDGNLETGEKGLFTTLRELQSLEGNKQLTTVKNVFDNLNNYMKSGYAMRRVINELNKIDFNKLADKQVFGTVYESILKELRDAGNKGEYYTPRAITQLMTQLTDPKLNEKVLDPAAGTGGFLTAAIDHIKENYVKKVEDEQNLQQNIIGWELKPVAFVLGLTNLILHGIDTPNYEYFDSLNKNYIDVSKSRKVDVILANPPFGASINSQIDITSNFPSLFRCKESADLFVVAILQLLNEKGRAAIVLPDGSITGDGVKARIREELLKKANLHTIIRLPQSTFFPATVSTNLLFFEKGTPTKQIWYYEHKLPEGQKSYSKTKPIQFKEFEPILEWWNNRTENENAWKIEAKNLKNFDLDIKNPIQEEEEELKSSKEYLTRMKVSFEKSNQLISELENLIS
ncbi:N-6 DNA methylase [Bernardetia sp. Wsw4-3y2]|uniref:class I SAM-dependent DNA methyltransferase n=1 Tax=Bernardetia sp. Wsw4-3y2 TaxID=3127471 RepID=UPI0030CFCBF1